MSDHLLIIHLKVTYHFIHIDIGINCYNRASNIQWNLWWEDTRYVNTPSITGSTVH